MFLSKAKRTAKTTSRAFESRLHGIEQLENKQLFASLTGDAVDTADHTEDQREPLGSTWGTRYAVDATSASGTAVEPGSQLLYLLNTGIN